MSVAESDAALNDGGIRPGRPGALVSHEGPATQCEQLDQYQTLLVELDPPRVATRFVGFIVVRSPAAETGPPLGVRGAELGRLGRPGHQTIKPVEVLLLNGIVELPQGRGRRRPTRAAGTPREAQRDDSWNRQQATGPVKLTLLDRSR